MGNGAFIPLGHRLVLGVDIWTAPPQVVDRHVVSHGPDGLPTTEARAVPADVAARLLTHSHTDHTAGQRGDWAADGPGSRQHCSRATAVHLASMFPTGRLRERVVTVQPGDRLRMRARPRGGGGEGGAARQRAATDSKKRPREESLAAVDDEPGVLAEVTVLPANHCAVRVFFPFFASRRCSCR